IFFPPTHTQAQAATAWAQEVEARTNGRVKINIFAGGTLTKGPQVYEGVLSGISDLGLSVFAYTRGRFPVISAIDLPMGYPDGMVASLAADAFVKRINPPEIQDVKLLYVHAHGPGLLHTKKPVRVLEDMAQMKIRSTGFSAQVVEALGGVPVAMDQGAAYEALKTGVVEGTLSPIEVLDGWKQAEVISHSTMCYGVGYTTAMFVVMNLDKWNSLPEDIKTIMEEVSSEWVSKHGQAWNDSDEKGIAATLARGNEIINLSKEEDDRWRDAARVVITKWRDDNEGGAAYVELLQSLIDEYSGTRFGTSALDVVKDTAQEAKEVVEEAADAAAQKVEDVAGAASDAIKSAAEAIGMTQPEQE
ncbi:MAG: TRAP transporter substrate-binding protein, partial [Desulfatibacillaceae bacterium]|nr:TRAP transporter substrate-binding protein [Desulfatibacillaceae bacterium]